MYGNGRKVTRISTIAIYFFLLFFALLVSGCSSSSWDKTTSQSLMSFSAEPFTYYSDGQVQDLEVYTKRITISVADEKLGQLTEWLQTDPLILQPPEIEDLGRKNLVLVTLVEGATEEQIVELIARLNASGLVEFATPVFGTEEEMTLITDAFVVRFIDTYSVGEIENYISSQNVTIIERDFLWPKCYRLAFTSESGANVLEVTRTFYESGMVIFAHPDFITITEPLWHMIAEEDFEGEFPKEGWSVYDQNPADGEYYWGKILRSDYFEDYQVSPVYYGDYLGWCSAGHADGLPDRDPIENCPESYAPNMDSWLVVGPVDLSQTYWAAFSFYTKNHDKFEGEVELLASTDGDDWFSFVEPAGHSFERGGLYWLNKDVEIGDLTGQESVWIALRTISDGEASTSSECLTGLFLDNVRIVVSNLVAAEPITSDPLSALQWGLHNTGQSGGEVGWDVNILPAWTYLNETLGGLDFEDEDSIVVAVIDEGVDLNHEDLNLVAGYDATYDPDDPEAVDSHGGPNPWDGHGTACAGIIGARNNDIGIVGVAPGIKIMPVRIGSTQEGKSWTTDSDVAEGILWAANNGAQVLSNSWGGGPDSDIKHNAIRDAKGMGCTLVFAAGNSDFTPVKYPSRYPETIAVGAMTSCGERKTWGNDYEGWGSNYGPELCVLAPGLRICTTDITGPDGYSTDDAYGHSGNYYKSFNGTSSATPHVAGIAALMLTVNPDLTPDVIREILETTARDLGEPGFDEKTGYGLVDACAAVTAAYNCGDLSVSQFSVPSPAVVGETASATCRVANSAPAALGPLTVRVYLSSDNLIDPQDAIVGETTTIINSGSTDLNLSLLIPAETAPESYMLIVSVDDDDEVPEVDEANNTFIADLQVIESAFLVVKPASVDFGTVVTGGGNQVNVELKNEGETVLDTLVISDITFSGDAIFNNTEYNLIPTTPVELGTNESTYLVLYFMPETAGTYSGTITITSNDPNAPTTQIPLTGVATEQVTHTITASAGSGGSISPQGAVVVLEGTDRTFTITPDTCHYISDVLVNGSAIDPQTSYTFENVTADHTIIASFGLLYFSITASAGTGGSISPSGLVPVACGGGRTFTITPDEHYHIADVLVDGVSIGAQTSYTFSDVNSTHTIQAFFAIDTHTLTVINTGTGTGTTTPTAGSHTYDYGTVVDISASPSANSTFDGWSGDIDMSGNTVTMDGNKSVTATFTLKTFTITATAGENGTIDPSGSTTVNYGSDQVFTFTPVDGYEVDTVTVDGQPTTISGNTYTFSNVIDNHTISVTFKVLVEETTWSKTYGLADWHDESQTYGLDVTDDGGYIFAAHNWYPDGLNDDFWVVRLDSEGNINWEKGFGGDTIDNPRVVRQTSDGGFIVAGDSYSFRTGDHYCDMWVIKLSISGAIEWQKSYGETGYDYPLDLEETFDDQDNSTGYLFAGETTSFGAGGYDIWLVKLSTSGSILHEVTIGGSGNEFGRSVMQTADGGCIVVADTQSFGAGGRDIWVVKLDSAWNVEWQKTFGGAGDEFPYSVVCADDGGYVVGARTDSFGAGLNDFWALKLDADGSLVWQYTYGGTGTDTFQDLAKTDDGGYIMTGLTLSFDGYSYNAWVVKLYDTGLIQWQKSYDVIYDNGIDDPYSCDEWAYKVIQASDGGYVVAGDTYNDYLDERAYDVWIIKVDSTGSLGCGMDTDTSAVEDGTADVTVGNTAGSSETTSAVVNATDCSVYSVTPDVFTQCGITETP